MTPVVHREKSQRGLGKFGPWRAWKAVPAGGKGLPLLPWRSRSEPLARGGPGKHQPEPRMGRGRSCRQVDWRLALAPQPHGAGLTAGDNTSRGRLDALSGC